MIEIKSRDGQVLLLHPEAVIVVPPELIQQPVEVEAVEP